MYFIGSVFVIEGLVFNAIDIRKPGAFHREFNPCSIGIQYNGNLAEQGERRYALLLLILQLREQFPSALILGLKEFSGKDIKPSKEMNQLRLELSDYTCPEQLEL